VPPLADDLAFRGLIQQVTTPTLPALVDHGGLVVYCGFDATGTSLHIGSLLQMCTLRRFQRAGHRVVPLVGGITGFIGDPTGRTDERALQSADELAANVAGVRAQLEAFFDVSDHDGPAATVLDNSAWLGTMDLVSFLRDVGKHFTVNQMIAKESVRARLERAETGISYTEFSYMLLQAYDFLRLHLDLGCTLQIGGSDQWGNITAGVELVRRVCREEVHGLTGPLVLKADGTKFGKSESVGVWLDPARTSPYRLYQHFVNVEDELAGTYLRYFSFRPAEEILALETEAAERPAARRAQRALAMDVVTLVHGAEEAERARRASDALFGDALDTLDETTFVEVIDDAPSSVVTREALDAGSALLVSVLVATGLCSSMSDARRTIEQGGVYVNNQRVRDGARVLSGADLLHDRYVVLRRGARNYHVLRVGGDGPSVA
jgi:tyrosyl-tRNA synthetase